MTDVLKKLRADELETVTGGNAGLYYNDGWRTVYGAPGGMLPILSSPGNDPANAVSGSSLSDGDRVQITGAAVQGNDGYSYIWVFSPKTGISGYVNSSYLA